MPASPFRRALAAATAILAAALAHVRPASAEIEKLVRTCGSEGGRVKLCFEFRASLTLPDGWVEDKAASRELETQMLLPKGQEFDKAPAKIYALVRYNREKKPVSDFVPAAYEEWRDRVKGITGAKGATMKRIADLPRQGGTSHFERHQLEAPALKEQGFELSSLTDDADRDGNQFVVAIVLSADTRKAFEAAMPAYLAILEKY